MSLSTSITRKVCLTELRLLLRDRRAFMLAIVLPMLLFPVLFFAMDALEKGSKESQQNKVLSVGLDLLHLDQRIRTDVRRELGRPGLNLTVVSEKNTELAQSEPWSVRGNDGRADPQEWRPNAEEVLERVDLLLVARRELREDGDFETRIQALNLVFDGSDTKSNEARRRVSAALESLRQRLLQEDLLDLLDNDPGASLELRSSDLASAENAAGHKLGGLLPIILVLIVISSASFAALGAFAGEREEGTIETLLVQPVQAAAVARGKFLAVLLVACAAAVGNGLSFLVSILLGLGNFHTLGTGFALGPGALRLGMGMLHFLPTAVFLSALLTLVSARARSFREGQHYVLPIVLVAALLASVSTQDSIPSNLLFALVPIAGPTLVLRDTLAGQFLWAPALLSFFASCLWSWLLLRRLAQTLDAERLFKSHETPAELAGRRLQSRRALRYGLLSVALIYIIGGRLQTAALIPGLLATLWILIPILAILCARGTAKRAGESLGQALGLVRVAPLHLIGALLISPALAVILSALLHWQSSFLPLPSGLEVPEALLELSPLALLSLLALSPGITEELLFRGAILGGLKKDLPASQVVAWQALLFGALHASLYRFLGTAFLGAVFALISLRARSIWPVMLAHAAYNAIQVLDLQEREWWQPQMALGLGLIGVLLIQRSPARTFPRP